MDWWNPDEETRRALRRWAKVNPMRAERPMHWMPEEQFDHEFYGEAEHDNSDERKLPEYG